MRNFLSFAAVVTFVAVISAILVGAGYLYGHNYVNGKLAFGLVAAVAAGAYMVWKYQPKAKHWAGDWPHKSEQDEMNELLKGF